MRSGFVVGRKTNKVTTVVYVPRAAQPSAGVTAGPIAGPFTVTAIVSK
jgi:hypothetical protein